MIYRVIGAVADKTELVLSFAEFRENAGVWEYENRVAAAYPYSEAWQKNLETASEMTAADYQFLHTDFGIYTGQHINRFIDEHQFHYQVALISLVGYTALYQPGQMISQLGSGASLAAETKLPVVTDLPSIDIILGGSGKFMETAAEKINLKISGNDDKDLHFSKAVCVALMGIFRWREEYNFLSSVTGAARSSIGGAVWLGQEA